MFDFGAYSNQKANNVCGCNTRNNKKDGGDGMSVMMFIMCGICVRSATIGITSIVHRSTKDKGTLFFFLLCIVNSMLSFGYANVMNNDSLSAVVTFRYLIVAGLVYSMQAILYLLVELADNQSRIIKKLAGLLLVIGTVAFLTASDGSNIQLVDHHANLIGYVLNQNWSIYFVSMYVLLVSLLALYVLYNWWEKTTIKRVKLQAGIYTIAFVLLSVSIQMVILIPLNGITMPPLSSVFIFLFINFVQQISKRFKTFNISFENLATQIYANVKIPILVTDFHGQIILANEATFSYFHIDSEPLYKTSINELFAKAAKEEETATKPVSLSHTFETKTSDGTRSVLVAKTGYNDNYGDLICSIYMIQDITETKRLIHQLNESIVEAEVANKAKSSFLANMSHEIRTPMNAIVGMAEITLQMELAPAIAANINSIRSAGLGLVTIINDILDFSKIELGKMEVVESEYILSSVIVDIVNMFAIRMANTEVLLLVDVNPRIPMYLIGDEIRLKQILVNIIGNAVKFTQKGYVKLEIDGAFDDHNETYSLFFNVVDTGIGIKEEDIPELFEMFTQVDTKKNRNIRGTGLGLSISKNLCQLMGGDITVESTYGEGSTFSIEVKQKVRRDNAPLTYVENPADKYVVIFEPDENLRQSFERMLTNLEVRHRVYAMPEAYLSALVQEDVTHTAIRMELIDTQIGEAMQAVQDKVKLILVTNIYSKPQTSIACSEIYLPFYAFQMADILNNKESRFIAKDRGADYSITPIPKAKVLVVDDTFVNLQVAQGLLAPYQMTVHTASSGQEAIEMVTTYDYDVVFMDHMMPVMDGVEATHAIRAMGGKYKDLTIIALTANAIAGAKEMFMSEGFDDFLAKPIETSKLKGIVKKWLASKYSDLSEEQSLMNAATEHEQIQIVQKADDLLDYEKGLGFLGGNPQLFLSILKTYYMDLRPKIETLDKTQKNGDIRLYGVTAHSIKSTSISLGVRDIPEISYALEKASKEGDKEYIFTHHGVLIEHLERLITEIERRFGTYIGAASNANDTDVGATEKEITASRIDDRLLAELMDAIDFCDPKLSASILAKIRTEIYPPKVEGFLNKLGPYIEQSNFTKAESILRTHMKGDDDCVENYDY